MVLIMTSDMTSHVHTSRGAGMILSSREMASCGLAAGICTVTMNNKHAWHSMHDMFGTSSLHVHLCLRSEPHDACHVGSRFIHLSVFVAIWSFGSFVRLVSLALTVRQQFACLPPVDSVRAAGLDPLPFALGVSPGWITR